MNIVLVLDNLRSVYNVASLFRTADCFGVSRIVLCGTTPAPVDRFGRTRADFTKISLGAELTVPWVYFENTQSVLELLRSDGYHIVCVEQANNSVQLHQQLEGPENCVIVLGAEVVGIGRNILDMCDAVWEIEQFGHKESLNVCIAGSLALYHLRFIYNRLS